MEGRVLGHVVNDSGARPFELELGRGWVVSARGVRPLTDQEEAYDQAYWDERAINKMLSEFTDIFDPTQVEEPNARKPNASSPTTSSCPEPRNLPREMQIHPRPNVKNWNRVNLGEQWGGACPFTSMTDPTAFLSTASPSYTTPLCATPN